MTPWPMARPIWSVALPAAKGTMNVMGLAGNCAMAVKGRAASSKASRPLVAMRMCVSWGVFLWV
ncbi:hypothetical protein D3C85_1818110 [compost metagenome]